MAEEKKEEVNSKISETMITEGKEMKKNTTNVLEDLQDDKTNDDVSGKKDEVLEVPSESQLKLKEEVGDEIKDSNKVMPKPSLKDLSEGLCEESIVLSNRLVGNLCVFYLRQCRGL